MRLIDADALKKAVRAESWKPELIVRLTLDYIDIIIDEQSAVDAVEVVRCKDCVHWYDKEETCLKIYSDGDVSPYAWQFRASNDFCSYGERRADGKDA